MKKLIYFFALLFSSMAIGQINYEPGYFISNDGQRTDCLIRNVNWRNTPSEFKYILNENDTDPKTAVINNIKEFVILNDVTFKKFTLEIDRSSSNTKNLTHDKNVNMKSETQFLKVLVEGEINLYEYNDDDLIRFFVSTGNHERVEQLIYKEYFADNNKIGKNNQFRQQLFLLLKSEDVSTKNFEKLKYDRDDISKLFIQYNKIKDPTFIEPVKQKANGGVNFKVVAGINSASTSLDYTTSSTSSFSEDFKKTIFNVGIEIEYVMPFQKNKWSIFIDPNFQSFSDKANLNNQRNAEVDYKIIQIPIGIRHFFFINEKSKIFINAGYSFNISQSSNLRYNYISSLNFPSEDRFKIQLTTNGFIGLGYSFQKYSLEFRYNLPVELTKKNESTYASGPPSSGGGTVEIKSKWLAEYTSFELNFAYQFL